LTRTGFTQRWRLSYENRDLGFEAVLVPNSDCNSWVDGGKVSSLEEDPHCAEEIQINLFELLHYYYIAFMLHPWVANQRLKKSG
jgi:hypothetical protein